MLPPWSTAVMPCGVSVDGSAETEQGGQDVEAADDEHGDDNGLTGGLGGRNGEEAHQDVRHTGGTKYQGHTEGDLVERVVRNRPGSRKRWPASTAVRVTPSFRDQQQLDMVWMSRLLTMSIEERDRVEAGLHA